jgi:hypothetical protein
MSQVETEAGPSVPTKTEPMEVVKKNIKARYSDATETSKEYEFPATEASTEGLEFIVRHVAGKKLSEERIAEAMHYAKDLKSPQDPWYITALMKMTFYIAFQIIKRYLSTGRWQIV